MLARAGKVLLAKQPHAQVAVYACAGLCNMVLDKLNNIRSIVTHLLSAYEVQT